MSLCKNKVAKDDDSLVKNYRQCGAAFTLTGMVLFLLKIGRFYFIVKRGYRENLC